MTRPGATGGASASDWGASRSPDLGAAPRVLLLPLGSTEQHGPHLPLDTDTRIAVAVAARVAATRSDVAVAPALPYGASGEHQGYAGTLSIGQAALELVVVELVRSIGPEVAHVVLVNGHGGNVEALTRALDLLRGEGRPVSSWSPVGCPGCAPPLPTGRCRRSAPRSSRPTCGASTCG